ncbi:predicted protein [Naegleria gruberi]|uniref:Predicted protein n=1 Tax=Naegleria gruberi TaxID=5762 RepID=D2W5P5_NAEGR|nr:uncharacterized protein NAEGRDRAFT_76736 [Naegleria gruberi]EFC35608.1 predicted protein [Naegleria gruberi]|eukprot:XP_002668352.1 predicted protein [Naegleria gruberi strain NEG-M]
MQIIHDMVGIGNELNPFSKDGKISQLWSIFYEVQDYLHFDDEQVMEILKDPQQRHFIQKRVSKYCSFYVEVFEKGPHYLHQMKYHLIEVWVQILSLKNGMNFINEGLGKYHVTDNLTRGRNGGLGSDSRWDLIAQHITEGFLFKNSKLWSELQKVMKARYKYRSSKAEFDAKLNESESLLTHHP